MFWRCDRPGGIVPPRLRGSGLGLRLWTEAVQKWKRRAFHEPAVALGSAQHLHIATICLGLKASIAASA
nr:MAG TPA_asm: acetyltransferase domain containing protein [Caudoviricetes sp.]